MTILRNPIRNVGRGALRGPLQGRFGGAVLSVAEQLGASVLYDVSQDATRYQLVNFQTNPAAADANNVGALCDISKWAGQSFADYMASQPEMVGDGWSLGAPWSYDSGTKTLTLNGAGSTQNASQVIAGVVSGRLYQIKATYASGTATAVMYFNGLGTLLINTSANGSFDTLAIATSDNATLTFRGGFDSLPKTINGISVKEVSLNPALQSVGASRPTYRVISGLKSIKGDGSADTSKTPVFAADGDFLITAAVDEQTSGTLVELRNNSSTTERIAITENQVEVRGDNGQADQTIAITLSGRHVVSVVATESNRKVEAFVDGVSAGSVTLTGTAWFDTTSTNKTVSVLATNGGADFSDGHLYWLAVVAGSGAAGKRTIAEVEAETKIA